MITLGQSNNYQRVLYTFGDSYTQGSGLNPDPLTIWGYANVLVQNAGWIKVNNAVGGTKVGDAPHTANMGLITPVARRDRILWLCGYNDMRFYGLDATALTNFGNTLTTQLTVLSTYGCPIILGTCPKALAEVYATGAPYDQGSDAAALAYRNTQITVAGSFPLVTVCDIYTSWVPNLSTNLQGDKVHPNYYGTVQLGQYFMATIIANGLK